MFAHGGILADDCVTALPNAQSKTVESFPVTDRALPTENVE
jgi:hypothetical protein